jgi:hypothetical protein
MPVHSASTFNLPFKSAIASFLNISSIEIHSTGCEGKGAAAMADRPVRQNVDQAFSRQHLQASRNGACEMRSIANSLRSRAQASFDQSDFCSQCPDSSPEIITRTDQTAQNYPLARVFT